MFIFSSSCSYLSFCILIESVLHIFFKLNLPLFFPLRPFSILILFISSCNSSFQLFRGFPFFFFPNLAFFRYSSFHDMHAMII